MSSSAGNRQSIYSWFWPIRAVAAGKMTATPAVVEVLLGSPLVQKRALKMVEMFKDERRRGIGPQMGRPAVNRQSGDHEGRRLMKSIASRVWTRTCMKIITRRANGDWSEMKDKFQELTLLERVEKGKTEDVVAESLTQELLETDKCYILDCGLEVYVWMGKNTSLDRKDASGATDGFLSCLDRPKCHKMCVIEGFETVMLDKV